MAINDFAVRFDNSYQETFQKALVAKSVMNTRFEKTLKYGESVERVGFDISAVRVRDTVRGSASTIDAVTDSAELLTINLEKEAVFHLSDGEVTQAGPLNPAQTIGKDIAIKVAGDLDGRCFAEVHNATYNFDTGDLTTGASTGVPITLSTTTVPQMTTRMAAKLRAKNNVEPLGNMVFVVDSYAAADIEQYLLGKDIDIAGSVFKNGYAGVVRNAQLIVSERLSGEVTLTFSGVNVDTKVITINGVTFTSAAVPAAAGEWDVVGSAADAAALFAKAVNNTNAYAAGTGLNTAYFELTAADRAILEEAGITATVAGAVVTIRSRSGRMTVAEDETNAAFSNNSLCAYFGKKGAIDLVVQDMKQVDIRATADRRGMNIFTSYLAGLKTFADGKPKFLKVLIAA
jgi:hypothetical protein